MASVRNALKHLQFSGDEIDSASSTCVRNSVILLPGVGSFSRASSELRRRGFLSLIRDHPRVIGICLGMQLLFSDGEEGGFAPGLGLLQGHVRSISEHPRYTSALRIPHVGWQSLSWKKNVTTHHSFRGVSEDMYFIHSYMACSTFPSEVLATVSYGDVQVPAVVAHGQVVGFQFHPEKSGPAGLRLLSKSISWVQGES